MKRSKKPKHTPGPWLAVECCEGFPLPAGVPIAVQTQANPWAAQGCICHMIGQGDGRYDPEVTAANARLIASAPQLLAMCEKLLHARTGDGLLDESSPLFAEASELIKAANGDA
jgi:hypothetical protein